MRSEQVKESLKTGRSRAYTVGVDRNANFRTTSLRNLVSTSRIGDIADTSYTTLVYVAPKFIQDFVNALVG